MPVIVVLYAVQVSAAVKGESICGNGVEIAVKLQRQLMPTQYARPCKVALVFLLFMVPYSGESSTMIRSTM